MSSPLHRVPFSSPQFRWCKEDFTSVVILVSSFVVGIPFPGPAIRVGSVERASTPAGAHLEFVSKLTSAS